MNILVVSRISIPAKDRTLPAWEHLRSLGHNVIVEHPESVPSGVKPHVIISMGVTVMDETFEALKRLPGVPLYAYMWDCYEWVWKPGKIGVEQAYHKMRGKEYDYIKYGELLRQCRHIWVPSVCTAKRCYQWWGVKNTTVILSACPWWDHPNVHDGGYALCTLRHLPDPWDTVFEECCSEIGIPHRRTDHELSYEEYTNVVAGCRFMVNHYYEASTGGLTCLEAYRLGKPVLISDSEWNGGKDYFGDRAAYFTVGDKEGFKNSLISMYTSKVDPAPDHKEWIETKFSDLRMVEDMMDNIQVTKYKPHEVNY